MSFIDRKKMKEIETESKLTLFDSIVQLGSAHGILGGKPESVIEAIDEHLDFVCDKLEITPVQAILLGDLFCVSDGDSVDSRRLAEHMKCKPIEIFSHLKEFELLERKSLVEVDEVGKRYSPGMSFKIPFDTIHALQKGECPEVRWGKGLTPQEFMERAVSLCEERSMDKNEYGRVMKFFGMLLRENLHLGIVKSLGSYGLDRDNELILIRFCVNHAVFEEEETTLGDLEGCHNHRSFFTRTKIDLRRGTHPLQVKGLIENVNHGGFSQRDSYCLTEKARDELLGEFENLFGQKTIAELKEADSIVEKALFYPEKTGRSVRELSDLLQEENWRRVRENLCEKGMRTGFACLFSGGPGTGKTETALQIAKTTGRAIMQVDIANTKSCWFGESEKRIKALFNHYRAAVKNSELTPILLFNEADAVIGKRQELGISRNGPGQTENAIQNIILQEIENLDGILIATTNLVENMDKAFERRFLYKIEFENPAIAARKSIWGTMIPELSDDDVAVLAEEFDFSGGQIENISRRRTVAQVLHGKSPELKELLRYCKDEQSGSEGDKRIGFF